MTKKAKKISKVVVTITIILAMVLTYFSPLVNVIAETYGSGDYHMQVGINSGDFTVDLVQVNDHNWTSNQDEFRSDENVFVIKIWVLKNGDTVPDIGYCGGECGSHIQKTVQIAGNGNEYIYTLTVTDSDNTYMDLSIHGINQGSGGGNEPNEPHFDGKAYVIWSCGNGTCYHYFDDIPNFDDGNSTFYKASTIKADNDPSKSFDVHADYKAWALPSKFEFWVEAYKTINNVENVNWAEVDPEDIISEFPPNMSEWEEQAVAAHAADSTKGCDRPAGNAPGDVREAFEHCIDEYYVAAGNLPFIRLQPVGEPSYNNAYVSYGDRNFKVVIYNDDYKGVAMGDLSELHYYPSQWTNPFVKRDQFDISGTTKNKPALLNSILLENKVIIKALDYNSFAIASIEALDVPEDAVTITKENNNFKIEYSSNFYDNVVFKVTDTNNEVSYIKIQRYTIDGWIKFVDNHPVLTADFFFDNTKSYADFELTAKIVYKDGTTKNVTLEANSEVRDDLDNVISNEYEVDEETMGGKGLKKSSFDYQLEDGEDRNISKVYLNAEYKGSTATNYAGAYVGSGEGVLANIYQEEEGE